MNIEIRKLTPDLAEDYVRFFDVTPHDDHTVKDELPCYCVIWRSDDSYVGNNDHWYPTREERRSRVMQFVRDGNIQGYLAYHGDEIVGWCNASADCTGGVNYLREFWPIEKYGADVRVKSVFCFVVAPEMQRRGIATKLLERVCKDATDDGFDYVEAYVNEKHKDHDFRGPLAMYEKCDFIAYAKQENRVVVRKVLK